MQNSLKENNGPKLHAALDLPPFAARSQPSEIEVAARAGQCRRIHLPFAQQHKTRVGEAGVLLSVGETQRLSLARAFLKNAPFLLMDEPTSALDVDSEAQVDQLLRKPARPHQSDVGYRLSTIRRFNKIPVIEDD